MSAPERVHPSVEAALRTAPPLEGDRRRVFEAATGLTVCGPPEAQKPADDDGAAA
jgi:hypothetical protein